MDLSSLMGTLLSKETVEGVSQKTGASQKDVTSVLTSALPQLFSGADKQANDSNTAAGFASALTQHAGSDTSNIGSFLSKVDLLDGAKIVGHLLGSNGSSQVASQTGVNASTTSNIMSATAPLLMSLLGKQSQKEEKQASSGGLGGLLSGFLGGGSKPDVGGMLSGLFGGKSSSKASEAPAAPKNPAAKPNAATKTATKTSSSSNLKASPKAAAKANNTGTATKTGTIGKKIK